LENLTFLQTKIFSKYYSITTNAILSLSIVFNFLGVLGNLLIKNIAGFLIVLGIVLLVGQILLVLNHVNRSDKIGWYLIRLAYVTMFVMMLGMLSIRTTCSIILHTWRKFASSQSVILINRNDQFGMFRNLPLWNLLSYSFG